MNLSTFLVLLVVCGCAGLACRSIYKDKKNGKSSCGGSCGHCGSHSMCENPKAFFDQIKKVLVLLSILRCVSSIKLKHQCCTFKCASIGVFYQH